MASANNQHCFVTTITDEKLPGYRHHHDNIWPEVAAGLRAAGIASLKIYCMPSGTRGMNTLGEEDIESNQSGRLQPPLDFVMSVPAVGAWWAVTVAIYTYCAALLPKQDGRTSHPKSMSMGGLDDQMGHPVDFAENVS